MSLIATEVALDLELNSISHHVKGKRDYGRVCIPVQLYICTWTTAWILHLASVSLPQATTPALAPMCWQGFRVLLYQLQRMPLSEDTLRGTAKSDHMGEVFRSNEEVL